MKISARNTFEGTISKIETGAVNTEVVIEITAGVEITAVITKASAENLGLSPGKTVHAVIKASDVMVAID